VEGRCFGVGGLGITPIKQHANEGEWGELVGRGVGCLVVVEGYALSQAVVGRGR